MGYNKLLKHKIRGSLKSSSCALTLKRQRLGQRKLQAGVLHMTGGKKPKYYEEIVQILFNKIKSGELRPGDRLPPERKLAEDMGVSRTVVREALRSLETMGYINQQIGNGTFIAIPTVSNLMDPFSAIIVQDVNATKSLSRSVLLWNRKSPNLPPETAPPSSLT